MNDYKEVLLNKLALKYVNEILSYGHTLANLLLHSTDFTNGKIVTYLPSDVPEEETYQFESGGKIKVNEKDAIHLSLEDKANLKKSALSESTVNIAKFVGEYHKTSNVKMTPVPNTDFWLSSLIESFITDKERSICVFENALAKPTDPWLVNRNTKILTFNDELYHFININNSTKNQIENTIREASSAYPPLIAILTVPDVKINELNDSDKVNVDILKKFVKGTEKIIIGAYDGESYIIWSKGK
ncbi:MAG: hypothetical protein ACREHC_05465 [Candidatus Levyibacteriota bacterium]